MQISPKPAVQGGVADEILVGELIYVVDLRKMLVDIVKDALKKGGNACLLSCRRGTMLKKRKDLQKARRLFKGAALPRNKAVQIEKEVGKRLCPLLFKAEKGILPFKIQKGKSSSPPSIHRQKCS